MVSAGILANLIDDIQASKTFVLTRSVGDEKSHLDSVQMGKYFYVRFCLPWRSGINVERFLYTADARQIG